MNIAVEGTIVSTSASEQVGSIGLDHYLFVLRRQWRLIAATVALGAVIAVGYLVIVPTEYTATTSVNLNVISTDPFNPTRPASGMLDNATEVGIAQSAVVATLAAEALPGLSPSEIRSSSEVTLTSETTIATITFTSTDPVEAEEGADAVASAYLAFRGTQATVRIESAVANLTSSIDELNQRLLAVNTTIANSPEGSAESSQATSERSQIQLELQDLLSQRNQLRGVDTTGGSVLSDAASNELQTAPSRVVVLGSGIAGGILVGVLLAFAVNPLDRRLRNAREMARAAGAPILAKLTSLTGGPSLVADADALRVARERVFSEIRSGTARLLVMDMTHDEGVSNHAVNFAVIAAQSQRSTLLIAPQLTPDQFQRWTTVLGLDIEGMGQDRVARSSRLAWLSVYVPHDAVIGRQDADLIITRGVRDVMADVTPGTVCVLAVTSAAHAASVLAALRESDAAVILARAKNTLTTEVARFVDESATFAAPLLGVLAAPGQRRRRAAVPAATGGADIDTLWVGDGSDYRDEAVDDGGSPSVGDVRESAQEVSRMPKVARHEPRRATDVAVSYDAD